MKKHVSQNGWKIGMLLLLSLVLLMPIGGLQAMAAEAGRGAVTVANEFLDVSVNNETGRFSIKTKAGSPLKTGDDNKPLLYRDELPETSFTTFRINGKDLIYGNGYGFLGLNGAVTTTPVNNGVTNQSVWKAEGLDIIQTLTLVDDSTNPNAGNVKISYKVKNTTDRAVSVGTRILLDTMLGPVDAAPISVSGRSDYYRNETKFEGTIPYYWRATDNPVNPKVMSYGFTQGWGNVAPNRMIVAHWNGISETKWDYTVDPSLDYTSTSNKYGSADSAVAMYWDPSSLAPGGEKVFETYYGLGSFYTSQKQAAYQLQVMAPKQLTLNQARTGYNEQQFEIRVDIDNSIDRSLALDNVTATIGLPVELELAEGERRAKSVGNIVKGGLQSVSWKVKAKPQYAYKAAPYQVIVQAAGGEESIQAAFIVLPALSGKIPEVQLLEALPRKLYMKDENPTISLQGKGFEALKGSSDWQVRMIRERDGAEVLVPKQNVSVLDDKQMSVRLLDSLWPSLKSEPGNYKLRLEAGIFGAFEKRIEFTLDQRFKPRDYGILLVVGENISPERVRQNEKGLESYSLVPVESEAKLKQLKQQYAATSMKDDKVVLLEFRGPIKALAGEETVYEIGSGATINAAVRYDSSNELTAIFGQASQKIVVKKQARDEGHEGDYISLSGNGVLSIPGFPFAFGPFGLELTDGTRYALEADEDDGQKPIEIDWEVLKGLSLVQQMGFFQVEMKNAVIGNESISFGGSVSMSFNPGDFKEEGSGAGSSGDNEEDEENEDEFELGLELDEARFGIRQQTDLFGRAGTFGFLGLRAEGQAGLPDGMVPGLDLGASGRVLLDTFDRKFEIEANVEFKVVEVNGLLTLRFTEGGLPIPDNFIFVVGAEPGIPLIPTTPVAYITKGGGGFRNMYDTLMGNFNILPPLKLVMVGGLSIAKVITADNVTLGLSMRGVEFSGEFEIVKFPILKEVYGSILLDDSLRKFGVALRGGAKLQILDIIQGEVYFILEYDSSRNGLLGPVYMAGGGNVTITIPKQVPFVGGLEIGSASGQISSEDIWGKAKIIGIPVGFQYKWGDSMPTLISSRMGPAAIPAPRGLMEQNLYGESGELSGTMSFGTNIRRIAGSASREGAAKSAPGRFSISSVTQPYSIPMPALQEKALLELKYTGDLPNLQVKMPDGTDYMLIENENYLKQTISAEDSQSGTLEKRVYVSFQQPIAGNWTIYSDQELEWSLMDVAVPASLDTVTATKISANQVKVDWQANHTSDEKVSLFMTTDNVNDPGRLLVEGIDVAVGTTTITLPEATAGGTYYIKAILSKSGSNLDSKYSSAAFTLVNPHQPAAPQQVTATPTGNGLLQVAWSMAQQPDGYTIQLLHANGQPVASTGTVDVAGTEHQAIIGGVMKDASGGIVGLVPGAEYQVSIASFKEVDGVKVYSTPTVSPTSYLPVPKPAQIELILLNANNEPILNSYGGNGQQTYVVNDKMFKLRLKSQDAVASTIVKVNQQSVGTFSGVDWTESIPLTEGTNLIEVLSTNVNGDKTLTGARVFSDTTAPDLKIESPRPGAFAGVGTVLVQGMAEPGSRVTINNNAVSVDSAGRFERSETLDGYLSKSIVVTARDDAGNETVYTSEVMNSAAKAFEKIELRPVLPLSNSTKLTDDGELVLPAGSRQALEAVGIDTSGQTYVIEPSSVEWSVLMGDSYGSVSERGELDALYEGELVVKASYRVTNDFAYEDTMVVNVGKPNGASNPIDPNYDNWYKPPQPVEDNPSDNSIGGNGDPKSPQVPPKSTEEAVNNTLENILKQIIEREKDVQFVAFASMAPNRETILNVQDRAVIRIAAQPMKENAGLGAGIVKDRRKYESDGLKVIGDIYEFKFDKPIQLVQPAELTIRFSLEEIQDLSKAAIYWFNERTRMWEYIGGVINPVTGTITANLPHFSKYALLYNEKLPVFEDIRDRWSHDLVYRLTSIGAVNGIQNGKQLLFEPQRSITRQEFLKIAIGALGIKASSAAIPANFADRDLVASWAQPYIAAAVERKWLSGTSRDGELYLDPASPISRAEAIAVIGRMLKSDPGMKDAAGASVPFLDAAQVPDWANDYVSLLAGKGIINGYSDQTLRPSIQISREEAAAMISKLLDLQLALE